MNPAKSQTFCKEEAFPAPGRNAKSKVGQDQRLGKINGWAKLKVVQNQRLGKINGWARSTVGQN